MCIDAGVNLIDTADVYWTGSPKRSLVRFWWQTQERRPCCHEGALPDGQGSQRRRQLPAHLIEACEASLKRLKTDVIDLYQLHEWDGHTPLDETMEALDTLVRQGKVRYIGCSNFSDWHIMKVMGVSEAR